MRADRDKTTGFMHTGAMVVRENSKQLVGICLQQMHGSTLDSVLLKAATERAMNAALIQQALREVCSVWLQSAVDGSVNVCSAVDGSVNVCSHDLSQLGYGLLHAHHIGQCLQDLLRACKEWCFDRTRQNWSHIWQGLLVILYWLKVDPLCQLSSQGGQSNTAAQVFRAVADAQEKLGFRHWDLRLANVMQHTPLQRVGNISEAAVEADSAEAEPAAQPELQYKVIDFGHGNLYDRQLKRYDRKAPWWAPWLLQYTRIGQAVCLGCGPAR